MKFCQSCGMPLQAEDQWGLQFLDEFNREADVPRTREQALAEMRQFFPALKRWQQK